MMVTKPSVEQTMRMLTIAVALGLAACAGQAGADGMLTISKEVATDFAAYQRAISGVGSGAYAVTEDGEGGASAGCPTANCQSKAGSMAIRRCENLNPGRKCVLFARNRDAIIPYEVGR